MGGLLRAGVEDDAAEDRLPRDRRDFDDAPIGQEFAQIAFHRFRIGRIGRAEIGEQYPDLAGRDRGMAGGNRHDTGCSGSVRSRLPVAEKTALAIAGATAGTPSSPTPPGASPDAISSTTMSGLSTSRGRLSPAKPRARVRPFAIPVDAPSACAMPKIRPPSICCRTRSGLTIRPQSTAATRRSTRIRPPSSADTSASTAMRLPRKACAAMPCPDPSAPPSQPPSAATVVRQRASRGSPPSMPIR
ncbi:hypothetical protein WR25_13609 [Diploscapter pachys]|uniref:Uncharacterized protein n=1 Tax=Diploscapter pachys TaxID=2018661 RepID=A0A2A2M484_9BILA|nr:hypothetical protein WR25_13609 [Diploscapter pachys]